MPRASASRRCRTCRAIPGPRRVGEASPGRRDDGARQLPAVALAVGEGASTEARGASANDEWLRIGGVKGLRRRLARVGHRALLRADTTTSPATSGVFAAEAIPLSTMEERVAGGRPGRAPGRDPRDRRPRQRRDPGPLREGREGQRRARTAASASSTRSTCGRPTSRASRSSASSPPCSRTTRSTTGGGRRSGSAGSAAGRPTRSGRSSTPGAARSSGPTGTSLRSRRSPASTPP